MNEVYFVKKNLRAKDLSLRLRSRELVSDTSVSTGLSEEADRGRETFKGEREG